MVDQKKEDNFAISPVDQEEMFSIIPLEDLIKEYNHRILNYKPFANGYYSTNRPRHPLSLSNFQLSSDQAIINPMSLLQNSS